MEKKKGTRTGYTTGACATACTWAALQALVTGQRQNEAVITLPRGERPSFAIISCEIRGEEATCAAIKDGGDDPDVTHGAEIRSTVRLNSDPGTVRFLQGEGVGKVTKPGLGLEVGGPAINPVPRQMMTEHALAALKELKVEGRGVDITVSVKNGADIAKKTLNARLGILGGISILGKTGIVYPYSNAAYIASIEQGIEVALHQGCTTVVLTTGGQTEKYAMALLPELPEAAFVQMGDFVNKALDHARKLVLNRCILVGQPGKVSKLAAGEVYTHAGKSEVDMGMLASLAAEAGAEPALVEELKKSNTARHVYEQVLPHAWSSRFFELLCGRAARSAWDHVQGTVAIESWLVDFEGKLLAKAVLEKKS
jgi:cobalt-precorrin-5B (C1)-methyltransferase